MRKHLESKLQQSCVKWFDLQYPKMRQLLFAIPNGGARSKVEASIMKGEGVRAGVADMFLAMPRQNVPEPYNEELYNGLFIEFKYGKGKQSDSQKSFQAAVDKQGFQYEVISDFDSFKNLIESYMPPKATSLKSPKNKPLFPYHEEIVL